MGGNRRFCVRIDNLGDDKMMSLADSKIIYLPTEEGLPTYIEARGIKKGELGGFVEKEENLSGDAWVSGDAELGARAAFTKGWFIGGDDTGKITNITEQTGSGYWKNQYVLGDYKIELIGEDEAEEKSDTQVEEFDPGMIVNRVEQIEQRLTKLENKND